MHTKFTLCHLSCFTEPTVLLIKYEGSSRLLILRKGFLVLYIGIGQSVISIGSNTSEKYMRMSYDFKGIDSPKIII